MRMNKRFFALLLTAILALALLPPADASDTVACLHVDSSLVIIGDSNTVFLNKMNPDIQRARILDLNTFSERYRRVRS